MVRDTRLAPHIVGLGVADAVDAALVAYLNFLYLSGHMFWRGERLLAGMMYYEPRFSRLGTGSPPRTWRAMRGWKKATPGRSRR